MGAVIVAVAFLVFVAFVFNKVMDYLKFKSEQKAAEQLKQKETQHENRSTGPGRT